MADIFPEEIIREILLRLPVKSLVRFRCVSKTWGALIDCPSFVKSHLKQSSITKSMMDIIFDNFGNCVKLNQLCYESSGNIVVEEFKHPFSPLSDLDSSQIMGSCYGLLYIIKSCNSDAILFNPSTRNHFKIPKIEEVEVLISCKRREDQNQYWAMGSFQKWWFWGCGYDEVNDAFKVVGINKQRSLGRVSETCGWIYSVKLGNWKRIYDMPNYHITAPECGTFLCNSLHWVLYNHPLKMRTPKFVAAFDMGTEEFRLVPLPKYIKNDSTSYDNFDLHVLDGCLCFSCSSSEDNVIFLIEFWIMREYRANESNWVKLMKVVFDSKSGIRTMKPITFSENGKLLLVYALDFDYNQTFAWYDLETGLSKRKVDNLPPFFGVPHFHIPSLVNPNPDHARIRN